VSQENALISSFYFSQDYPGCGAVRSAYFGKIVVTLIDDFGGRQTRIVYPDQGTQVGLFRLNNIPPGKYKVTFNANGWVEESNRIVVVTEDGFRIKNKPKPVEVGEASSL